MQEIKNIHIENDKVLSPYLLSCSYNGLIKFEGSYLQNRILYFQFSPKAKVVELIDNFQTKTDQRIPAKDIFEAIKTFWLKIEESRNGEIKNDNNKK